MGESHLSFIFQCAEAARFMDTPPPRALCVRVFRTVGVHKLRGFSVWYAHGALQRDIYALGLHLAVGGCYCC